MTGVPGLWAAGDCAAVPVFDTDKFHPPTAQHGRPKGVAMVFGIKFSGFVAWVFWRTVYLMKLPRLQKKLRVIVGLDTRSFLRARHRTNEGLVAWLGVSAKNCFKNT